MASKRRPRILLAEDERHSRVLMKAVLASLNCDVIGEAKTGVEAVELYKKLKPDLMLLDVNMPLKTGNEVLKEILSDFPKAFIIILTSVSDVNTITECLSLGAANYIRKDTPIAEIKAIIKETWSTFLQNQRSRP